ncbi:MAG: hypothetical protein AB1521_17465 [Bacteroidota bacterium]
MYKLKLLLIILFSLVVSAFAQDCVSYLEIETNRDSSFIFVNNELKGSGKVRIPVSLGIYHITIKEELLRWNEHEINDSVTIKLCDKEYLVSYNLFDKVFIDSNPQNAAMYIYDSLMAYTPNYVNVNQFQSVNFKKNGTQKTLHSNELGKFNVVPLDYIPSKPNGSFTNSDWFKVLLGSAAILGATAAYFKIQADKKYDEYVATKNPALLNDVDRYDVYSGVAFGLLQVNFGYLIYKFLTD